MARAPRTPAAPPGARRAPPSPAGDAHNFGRRVVVGELCVRKPRTLLWEWLLLAETSPLRALLGELTERDGPGRGAFGFLPDLAFSSPHAPGGGEVTRLALEPLGDLSSEGRRSLARVLGRALALFSWLGLSDLHWENLALGRGKRGEIVVAPLDVEMIFSDLARPTETKLLPDADPEVAAICRHACGVRRVLPYLGKPIEAPHLVEMAGAYRGMLEFLERHTERVAAALAALPGLREAPIRVLLRGTDEYVRARRGKLWPPLLDAEREQLARGDIPYFFRLYGRAGIHYYGDESLTRLERLPLRGDVPRLDPLLDLSRGLRSPSRKRLREEGLFTVLGAFDHPRFSGSHEADELTVTFAPRSLVVRLRGGEELETRRALGAFVGSVYLPCRCGEVLSVLVPPVTACEAPPVRRLWRVQAPPGRSSLRAVESPACETCRRPKVACVCDRIVSYPTTRRVLVLQHPQEQDAVLGSAQLLMASLPQAKLVVGLSWPNFAAALGEPDADARRWAVLFPDRESPDGEVVARGGAVVSPGELEGIVVLDGTWSKAKTLWWRNPWLLKLSRLTLKPSSPSIYGSLRAEPRVECVSTLESVAAALTLCGEPPEIEAGLRRVFRTMVQRVRDAGIIPKAARRPPPKPGPARPPRKGP